MRFARVTRAMICLCIGGRDGAEAGGREARFRQADQPVRAGRSAHGRIVTSEEPSSYGGGGGGL